VFASGMAAIVTLMLAYVRSGETVLHSRPLYGGTEVLIDKTLAPFGVKGVGFTDGLDEQKIRSAAPSTVIFQARRTCSHRLSMRISAARLLNRGTET
jgi:cystathionine beta-lyase/cystathionine gamma-synthase